MVGLYSPISAAMKRKAVGISRGQKAKGDSCRKGKKYIYTILGGSIAT
jgi:hypothetical protein